MAGVKHDVPPMEELKEAVGPTTRSTVQSQGVEAFKDIAFGSTAGMLAKFVEYPFDTVKVRLQSQVTGRDAAPLNGPLDAFRAAFRAPEGPIRSLYRGISAPLLGAAIETSSLFFSYRIAQDILIASTPSLRQQQSQAPNTKLSLPLTSLLACGAASGAFTSLLLTPIELVKCKMQVPITPLMTQPPSAGQLIASIFRQQGILGFWHGQLGTLIRETGGSAAWFGSYEGLKILYLRFDKSLTSIEDVKVWQQLSAGAIAGMSYNFVFYPADTIKSRMQTEDSGKNVKSSFASTTTALWKEQGIRGMYRGCGITVFRAAPSSAIIFSIYEALRRYFG
jgi:mitochondrial ornithine carrier protein